ncbi:MAG: hypothetical protein HC900_01005 [Methylacidiphilales bacterium]|nr:hypothetical protein [Candidatus Methylacidiphilales bacterium]
MMTNWKSDGAVPDAPSSTGRRLLFRELPYLAVLALSIFGAAYTSFSGTPLRGYWIALGPIIGLVCILSQWRAAGNQKGRLRLIWTQILHWGAVLGAIELLSIADVSDMMSADASALSTLTILALGTFTAGIHISSWHVALVGIVLALTVPGIAWLEESALLMLLIAIAVVGLIAPFVIRRLHKNQDDS